MFTRRAVATAGAGALLTASTALCGMATAATAPYPGDDCSTRCVLDLELNGVPSPQNSGTVPDTSGMGHDGRLGPDSTAHLGFNGSSVFFDRHVPTDGFFIPDGNHLITVPDAADGSLDPGTGNFSVIIRYRTKEKFGNVIQKGQATTAGGQVKFQQPKGKMTCMFKTPTGTATAGSGTTPLNDNLFHTVRCDRTPTSVTMWVDGVRTGRVNHTTGNLDNKKPWSIGGKLDCDTVAGSGADSCDYFSGDIDYVRIIKGSNGGDGAAPAVTATTPADGDAGVARTGNITASFDEPVKGVSATTMVLRKTSTGVKFGGAVSYDETTRTAVLDPNVTLPGSTEFTVTLTSGISDTSGNTLPQKTWSFTTGR